MAYGIDQLLLQEALRHGLDVLRDAAETREVHDERQISRRASARHPRLARRAGVRTRRARRYSTRRPASNGNTCRRWCLQIDADLAARYDAIYVNTARVPEAAVARADCRLRVVARHGVGYDSVDVPAMTRAGVLVTNTPSSMPRPVATTALTFLLALAGKLFLKDRLTRSGRWHERMDNMGTGAHRTHARRDRGRTHRPRTAAHGAHVRSEAARERSAGRRDRVGLPRCAQGRRSMSCCSNPTSSSSAACSRQERII